MTTHSMYRLNLGSGQDIRLGWVNLDLVLLPGLDVVADIEVDLPLSDDSFHEIESYHVLEHVDNLMGLLAELHRIIRPGGVIKITVPHLSFFGAYTDPTHKRFFGYHSFDYFTDQAVYNFYSTIRFRITKKQLRFYWIKNERREIRGRVITALLNLMPLFYERFLCWLLPVNEVYFELEPVKAQPKPEAANTEL